VLDRHEVIGVTTEGNRVTGVDTDRGHLAADIVVCCAGIWGPTIAAMVGQSLALTPLAHQLAWTEPLAALAGHRAEATRPVLRHQDAALYYRENGEGIGIGSYRHRAIPVGADELTHWSAEGTMPSVLPFTPDDFQFALAESARVLPATAGAKLVDAINGVFSFTVYNMPLLGPHPLLPGEPDATSSLEAGAAALRELIDLAVARGGSYYLTYHRWARRDQVEACYPQMREFLERKLQFDPDEVFQSDWYRHYRRMFGVA